MKKNSFKKVIATMIASTMLFSLVACGGGSEDAVEANATGEPSNIILTNATVYTVDEANPEAEAVVVQDGVIAYVGDAAGAEEYQDDNSLVIDMQGNTVMPSMVDSHMHPATSAISYYFEIGLTESFSIEEYQQAVADYVAEFPNNEVYTGSGYMRSIFDEVGPRKETIDEIVADRPVILQSGDGHSVWVNSKALEMAGITKDTPDPLNGVIQRDPETGEPSGLLQESAMGLVDNLKPVYTKEQYKEAINWLEDWLNERGVTTVFDAMVSLDNENYYMAYQEMAEAGELSIRIRGAWHLAPEMGTLDELMAMVDDGIEKSKGFATDYFQINSFKFFADQVLEEKTAYMSTPYLDADPSWRGIKTWEDADLEALFTKIDAAGFQIHAHQIGDEAATYALDAFEKVQATNGERDSRHTFAHVQFMKDEDIVRTAELKMNAIIAPYWAVMDDYYWDLYLPYVGQEVIDTMYPAQRLVDAGINVATHSDFFVTEPDMGWLYYSAVTRALPQKIYDLWYEGMDLHRTTETGIDEDYLIGPLKPYEDRMTLAEIVASSTYNGAYSLFMEDEVGSIEVGKKADLVMLDLSLFEADIEDVANVTPVGIIFDGNLVYEMNAAQ